MNSENNDKTSPVFDQEEQNLVNQVISAFERCHLSDSGDWAQYVKQRVKMVYDLWQAIESYPSLFSSTKLGSKARDFSSLVGVLSTAHPYTIDLFLPTRGMMSRSFSLAKFNFFRMLNYSVEDGLSDNAEKTEFLSKIGSCLRQTLEILLIEEITRSVAIDQKQSEPTRRKATLILAHLWEKRSVRHFEQFFPLLISTWEAKRGIKVTYGTLAGVIELMCLARDGCNEYFLDYFRRGDITEEELWALKEFIFNISYEEQQIIIETMRREGKSQLDAEDISRILKVQKPTLRITADNPTDMLYTFRERKQWAEHRRLRNLPGPKRTAEAYIMIHWLDMFSEEDLMSHE